MKEGLAKKALDSVKERLDTKYGIMLHQPAYTRYYLNLGEISSYPPGYKENAGIFCHNNPWISIAETVIGRGNRAFEIYKKTCPSYIENISEIHRTEPYVYSQMIARQSWVCSHPMTDFPLIRVFRRASVTSPSPAASAVPPITSTLRTRIM